ncbi:MAG: BadF/BadG/BcrA/BcrD ATPase family protein [Cyanobium sp.]
MDPHPDLIAGFDAGQTHTTCRLADAGSGVVVAEGQGSGVCHLAAATGPRTFLSALRSSLADALGSLAGAGVLAPPASLRAAAVGASGIEMGTAVQRQGLELAAEALALPATRLWVGGDERTALRGAFPQGPGIVVISGTGTIAVGRDAAGREHRCAGWGWILDGAGSACDIGRDALALTLRMADGRVPRGALLPQIWSALELDPDDPGAAQAIKARVVQPGFAPAGLAALAPAVEALAQEGDADALGLLRRHANALAASSGGVARALQLQAPQVAAQGGAITHLQIFRALFQEELLQRFPQAALVKAAGDAASGALAIARELVERGEGGD